MRSITLLDMAHDGVRSVVYQYLFERATSTHESTLTAIQTKYLKELTEFKTMYDEQSLVLASLVQQSELRPVQVGFEEYLRSAESVIHQNDPELSLSDFTQRFDVLETQLLEFGEKKEAAASGFVQVLISDVRFMKLLLPCVAALALVLTLIVCYALSRSITGYLKAELIHFAEQTEKLDESVENVKHSSVQLKGCSEIQERSQVQFKYSIESLSHQIQSSHSLIQNLAQSSAAGKEELNVGSQSLRELFESIEKLHASQFDFSGMVNDFVEQVEASYSSLELLLPTLDQLDQISKKSKILSINASMEASRAGEAGKGFVVDAEEIRELAKSSEDITQQIKESLRAQVHSSAQETEVRIREIRELLSSNSIVVERAQSFATHNEKLIQSLFQHLNFFHGATDDLMNSGNSQRKINDDLSTQTQLISQSATKVSDIAHENTQIV